MSLNFDVDDNQELIIVSKTLDIVKARSVIEAYSTEIGKLSDRMNSVSVTDESSRVKAVEIIGLATRVLKEIEKKRDEIIREPKSFTTAVNNLTKDWEKKLKAIAESGKDKIKQYNEVLEQNRRIEEKKRRDAAEALQKELNVRAEETGTVAPIVPEVFIPEKKETVHTEYGSQHTRKKWSFRVKEPYDENIKLVPAHLIQLNDTAVRNAIKMGSIDIPGLEIWEEDIIVVRT